MDGDVAPLKVISHLAHKHGALVGSGGGGCTALRLLDSTRMDKVDCTRLICDQFPSTSDDALG